MFDVTDPDRRKHALTERKGKAEGIAECHPLLSADRDFAPMAEHLGRTLV